MIDDLWGPLDMANWLGIPVTRGRLATEADVAQGCAVFFLQPESNSMALPYPIALPACAILYDESEGNETPVVVIQAEQTGSRVVVGYRFVTGGNGICTLPELLFLETPDHRFSASQPA